MILDIVVLDYSCHEVFRYMQQKFETGDSDEVEEWLRNSTDHQLSNCSWMSAKHIFINEFYGEPSS